MLGGFRQHDDPENDEHVKAAAEFAVSEISSDLKLEKILSAHKQVVAGTIYKLELQTSSGNFEAQVFKGLGDVPFELKTYKKVQGEGNEQPSGQLGGMKELSTSDDEVTKAAQFAVDQLGSRSNSLYPLKLEEVLTAHSKVHGGGTEYTLKLRLSQQTLPDSVVKASVTRTLENANYKLGDVNNLQSSQ